MKFFIKSILFLIIFKLYPTKLLKKKKKRKYKQKTPSTLYSALQLYQKGVHDKFVIQQQYGGKAHRTGSVRPMLSAHNILPRWIHQNVTHDDQQYDVIPELGLW